MRDTDPAGMMMMDTQMVEILGKDYTAVDRTRVGVYMNSQSMVDPTFLVARA